MKRITLIILISVISFPLLASTPIQKVHKYEMEQEGTIRLPTDFADALLLHPELARKITGKTIYHIDLVYTAYKESPDFNQEALNNNRIEQLKRLLPQVSADNPSWTWVEQEGAETREEAKAYFHGFVLHFGNPLDFKEVRKFLKPFQTAYSTYIIENAKGGVYIHSSGSRINIPANAVIYEDGTPVVGPYELQYREFRDQADIAFSGIPMTYDEREQNYNFSSAGMFELRAKQGDAQLKLAQPVSVDFNCTRQADDVDFYEMDDESGVWEKKHPVAFNNARVGFGVAAGADMQAEVLEPVNLSVPISEVLWRQMEKSNMEDQVFQATNLEGDRALQMFEIDPEELPKGWNVDPMPKRKWWKRRHLRVGHMWGLGGGQVFRKESNTNGTLLAEGVNEGHTYPNLVRGLNTPEFGVYNCDQIYRIGTPANISPIYVDAATGKAISRQHVTCVVDLNYNGSFSFHPRRITCNTESRNVVLLFTSDEKTYVLSEEKFAALKTHSGETPTFEMEDMTDALETSEDLREYLNL